MIEDVSQDLGASQATGLSSFGSSPAVSPVPASIPSADTVPVISMWQPFASLLFTWDRERGEFAKAFETRSFKLPARLVGKRVAIHATAKFPSAKHISPALNDLCYDMFGCGYNYSLPFGAIIGVVEFGAPVPTGELAPFQPDTEIAAGDWSPGRWAWPVMLAEKLDLPVPMKGKQGWWKVAAQAIEARRAETGNTGSVEDESAVRQDAPTLKDHPPTEGKDI